MPAIPNATPLRIALELDGAHAAWLSSAQGGDAVGEVVAEGSATGGVQAKHIGVVRYEDIVVTVPLAALSSALWQTLQAMLAGKAPRSGGAIVSYGQDLKERARLTFTDALVAGMRFGPLDAASKNVASMTITLKPARTRSEKPSGASAKDAIRKTKALTEGNFRIAVDGLEEATKRVSKIAALNVAATPLGLEIPNLVITLAQSAAAPVSQWHEDFVIAGNNGEGAERGGSIELLAPDLSAVLLRIELAGLGIFKLAPDRSDAGTDAVSTVTASMYCEQLAIVSFPA